MLATVQVWYNGVSLIKNFEISKKPLRLLTIVSDSIDTRCELNMLPDRQTSKEGGSIGNKGKMLLCLLRFFHNIAVI